MVKITPIPILSTNYCWVLQKPTNPSVYVVDPGEAQPVIEFLNRENLTVEAFLITHSHNDHIGGLNQLLKHHNAPVYGPDCKAIPQVSHPLDEHSTLHLWQEFEVKILHTPGHLPEHICFFIDELKSVFSGDMLFSSGCGRNFVGTAHDFHHSLQRLQSLGDEVNVYCTHEYTVANIEFAMAIEPNNPHLKDKLDKAKSLRSNGIPTLPTTIAIEKDTNPFLRTHIDEVKRQAESFANKQLADDGEIFGALRKWKDVF